MFRLGRGGVWEGKRSVKLQVESVASLTDNLEGNITLGRDAEARDVGSAQSCVNVGGPVVILPFDGDAVIGLDGGGQRVVVTEVTAPGNRDVSVAVDGGGDGVGIIDGLGDGDFLAVSGGGELDVGVSHAVVDDNLLGILGGGQLNTGVSHVVCDNNFLAVGGCGEFDVGLTVVVSDNNICVFGGDGVCWGDGEGGTVHINSLGGRDGIDSTISGGDNLHGKVGIIVGGVDSDVGGTGGHGLGGSGRDSPSSNVGLEGSEDLSWERGNVGGGKSRGFDTVFNVHISRGGASRPAEGGVQSINSIEASIRDRDL